MIAYAPDTQNLPIIANTNSAVTLAFLNLVISKISQLLFQIISTACVLPINVIDKHDTPAKNKRPQ